MGGTNCLGCARASMDPAGIWDFTAPSEEICLPHTEKPREIPNPCGNEVFPPKKRGHRGKETFQRDIYCPSNAQPEAAPLQPQQGPCPVLWGFSSERNFSLFFQEGLQRQSGPGLLLAHVMLGGCVLPLLDHPVPLLQDGPEPLSLPGTQGGLRGSPGQPPRCAAHTNPALGLLTPV